MSTFLIKKQHWEKLLHAKRPFVLLSLVAENIRPVYAGWMVCFVVWIWRDCIKLDVCNRCRAIVVSLPNQIRLSSTRKRQGVWIGKGLRKMEFFLILAEAPHLNIRSLYVSLRKLKPFPKSLLQWDPEFSHLQGKRKLVSRKKKIGEFEKSRVI